MSEPKEEFNKHGYSADSIQALEGMEHVRMRPSMYIGDVGVRGLHHLVYEVVDNSIDEAMGGYSPTIGIIGAVMGLIQVMTNLEDPQSLGGGIATAFVATIYGVALANLLFFPVANKLRGIIKERTRYEDMMIDGIIAIAEGENPKSIELRLRGFLQ